MTQSKRKITKKYTKKNIKKNKHTKKHKYILKNTRYFANDDYKSGDGMLTSVWGPALWHYLHTMSFNYPTDPTNTQKKHYRDFVLNLQNVLPCKYCRMNLVNNFKKLPLTMKEMKSRDTFSRYVYNLHEEINTMLGKKSNLSFEDVRERYEHFRARCGKRKTIKIVRNRKKHKGCTESLYKIKSKGVIQIVPQNKKCDSIVIDEKCQMK